nr:MAK10-like protein [Tanacetum cinerariifolium]
MQEEEEVSEVELAQKPTNMSGVDYDDDDEEKHPPLLLQTSLHTPTGDENPIRTLGDYSKLSHEGYRSTIKLPVGNNVVPLRSDIIRLVQNGFSFHGLQSEDPNQHLKGFLKLLVSLDLDDPEQAHVEYASSRTDEVGGKWYTFKPEQNNLGDTYNPSWRSHPNLRMEIETQQSKEPKPTLEDEFQDLHLNLSVLEVIAHAPIYNSILDKYVESLELSKNGLAFIQGEVPEK